MELITLEQNAVITQKFEEVSKEIDTKVERAKSLSVTEDNFRDVKKIRAELNKESKAFAEEFKKIKKEVLEPWNKVEDSYKELIRDKYANCDKDLKHKIDEIQDGIIGEKREKIEDFFEKHREANNLLFVRFGEMPIKINMSATIKSMEKAIVTELDRIKKDVDACMELADGPEIFAEYKINGYDFTSAVTAVKTRKEAAERLRAEQEARKLEREQEQEKLRQLEEERAKLEPEVIEEPEAAEEPEVTKEYVPDQELVSATFTVTATLEQMKELVRYMRDNNIEFKQI